jgi:peptidyl-prolyl cis-trans isomerase SurA
MNGMTQSQLLADIGRQSGMNETEYRQEIRQQIIEGKLMQRVIQTQIRITRQDLEEMYQRMVERERHILLYQAAWIVLPIGGAATTDAVNKRMREAEELTHLARGGADFADLARRFSEDSRTREDGGDLGIRAPTGSPAATSGQQKLLAEPLEKVALGLAIGQVSEPFRFKDAIIVMKLNNRQPSRYTSFEAAQNEMQQRVQAEKLDKAKQKWLKDLRRRTHVDVRFL